MHDKNPLVAGADRGQGDQFVRRGKNTGRVNQSGRQTEGTLIVTLLQQLAHSVQLRLRQGTFFHACNGNPQRSMTGQRRQVGRRTLSLQPFQVFAKTAPGPGQVWIAQQPGHMPPVRLNMPVCQRRQAQAILSQQFGRDSLANFRGSLRFDHLQQIGMTVHIDETRRQRQAPGVDHTGKIAGFRRDPAYFANQTIVDCHIGDKRFFAGSVDNRSALDQKPTHRKPPSAAFTAASVGST